MPGRPRSWSDEDLIRAVEESTTLTEVLQRLRLAVGGGSLTAVRRRILELGLDNPTLLTNVRSEAWAADPDDDLAQIPTRGRWSDDDLRWAVATATSMREVMGRLGYPSSGSLWTVAKAQIKALDLDTSHFGSAARRGTVRPPRSAERRCTWTDDDLREAVGASKSLAGVIRALGLKVGGSVYVLVRERIAELDLDTSHFTGRGWSKGQRVTCNKGRPLEEILVENSTYRTTSSLRQTLIKEGLKEARCEICGLTEWCGQPIPLQLDHVDGDRPTTGSKTCGSCVQTATRRRTRGVARTSGRCVP